MMATMAPGSPIPTPTPIPTPSPILLASEIPPRVEAFGPALPEVAGLVLDEGCVPGKGGDE